jgi:hypothetical protein
MGGPAAREEGPEVLVPDDDHGLVVRDERSARRRQRRQTWTFMVAFMLVLGTGVGALTHYQGVWAWPFADPAPVTPAAACTDVSTLLPAKSITLHVYNASDKSGLAGRVGADFGKRGFRVDKMDNDPLESKVTTVAMLRYGKDGALAARTVGAHVRGSIARVQDERVGDTVDLVLSGSFAMRTPDDAARVLRQVAKSLGACGARPSPTSRPTATKPAPKPKPKPSTPASPTTAATR